MISESEEVKRSLEQLLRTADLGLVGVEAREMKLELEGMPKVLASLEKEIGEEIFPRKVWQVNFKHEGKGHAVIPLDMNHESAGTCRFFNLLGPWLELIKCGDVVCVDELDTSLHPTLVAELLRFLFHATQNGPGAQVLFTTHNPLLLDMQILRRDQIWLADKDKEGASFLYPLTDYKPRADESLIRGYLSGRYGAVPFIPQGLAGEKAATDGNEAGRPEAVHAR
jgi:AAA15 family ATPase/GTPase